MNCALNKKKQNGGISFMQTGAEIFNQVLLQGEQVIKTFRPHKGRFWLSRLSHLIGLIPFMLFPTIILVLLLNNWGPFALMEGETYFPGFSLILGGLIGAMVGIPVFFFGIEAVFSIFWYKNRLYCFTNKRVMIQCGVFGRNFRFMDLQWATNSFVQISVLDRMLGKNTGSIKFSSMGNPMMNMNQMGGMGGPSMMGAMFYFLYVVNPHDILREIQEQANALQANSANQMANLANQMGNLANAFGNQNMNNMGGMQGGGFNQGGMQGGFNNQAGNTQSGFFDPNQVGQQQQFNQQQQMQAQQMQQQQQFNQVPQQQFQQPQQPVAPQQPPQDPNNNSGWGNNDGGGW